MLKLIFTIIIIISIIIIDASHIDMLSNHAKNLVVSKDNALSNIYNKLPYYKSKTLEYIESNELTISKAEQPQKEEGEKNKANKPKKVKRTRVMVA